MKDELFHLAVFDEHGVMVINDIYIGFDPVADLMHKYSIYKRKEILRTHVDDGLVTDRNTHYSVSLEKIVNNFSKLRPTVKQCTFKVLQNLYKKHGELYIHKIFADTFKTEFTLSDALVYKDINGVYRKVENDVEVNSREVSYSHNYILHPSLLNNLSFVHDLIEDYKDELIFKYCLYQSKSDPSLLLKVTELIPFNNTDQLVLMCVDVDNKKYIYSRGNFLANFDVV
jgi:hypothetical protein